MLYLLDARHEVEERLLREWVDQRSPGRCSGGATPAEMMAVHLEGEIEATGLSARLDAASEHTEVVPLRVMWSPAGGTERSGPRLRHLLIGDPRRPAHPGDRHPRPAARLAPPLTPRPPPRGGNGDSRRLGHRRRAAGTPC